jgi:chitin synthase
LVTNPAAIADIPGGLSTVDMMRWMLIASLGLYVVPIVIYLSLFGRLGILCEVLLGSLSFLFYSPTYLNILNVYSLCRIDDISWGTKGLDT